MRTCRASRACELSGTRQRDISRALASSTCSCCQAPQNRGTHLDTASPSVATSGNSMVTPSCTSPTVSPAHNGAGRLVRQVLVFLLRNIINTQTGGLNCITSCRNCRQSRNRSRSRVRPACRTSSGVHIAVNTPRPLADASLALTNRFQRCHP